MARLALDAAPPVALPAAGLLLAAAWGVAAGVLLVADGALATATRWSPSAFALVHALTLGVFGNAATAALLQFLPAAAGSRIAGGPRTGATVLVLFNAGAIALVLGFRVMRPSALVAGALLVASAVGGLAVIALPGLLRSRPRGHLRMGLAAALVALASTAGLGLAMTCGLVVNGGLAPAASVDVHATFGLGGAMTLLVASVAQQVMPMFQGTDAMRPRGFGAWLVAVGVSLCAVAATHASAPALAALGACSAAWAASTLRRHARTGRPRRNPVLVRAWRGACVAMIVAVVAGVLGNARLAGTLALGLALPLFVMPMLLEISAFLGWLGLYRTVRGRVPGVHALQPERAKGIAVSLQAVAGLALVAAVASGADTAARTAGVALFVAHSALLVALLCLYRRCRAVACGHAMRTPIVQVPDA